MLEQQQIHAEEPKQYAPTAYENNNAAMPLTPHANALAAAYIAHIEAEQQDATRARLEELIAAHLELDATPEQAARSAIQQLENERLSAEQQQATARQQAFEQRKRTRSAKQSARPATLTALKVFGVGSLTMIGTMVAMLMLMNHFHGDMVLQTVLWLVQFMCFGLPILLGAAVGARAKHRPALGTFYAMGILTSIAPLVGGLVMSRFDKWDGSMMMLAVILTLFWMPIGVVSAGLTGWGRDALRRKRRKDASTRGLRLEE